MKVLSVHGECETVQVIEKSRFITRCAHVENEEEAKAFIAKVRAEHIGATHNCFAYVADKTGTLLRFSDDGEPGGTAGMPILDVIRNKKLFETAVVVTRYFGGIKLGAGGLVRAYSSSAAQCLDQAQVRLYEVCTRLLIEVGYDGIDPVNRFLSSFECENEWVEYAQSVTFSVVVRSDDVEKFCSELINFMNGRVEILEVESFFYPFGQC